MQNDGNRYKKGQNTIFTPGGQNMQLWNKSNKIKKYCHVLQGHLYQQRHSGLPWVTDLKILSKFLDAENSGVFDSAKPKIE